jgi:hypothetical protein
MFNAFTQLQSLRLCYFVSLHTNNRSAENASDSSLFYVVND